MNGNAQEKQVPVKEETVTERSIPGGPAAPGTTGNEASEEK